MSEMDVSSVEASPGAARLFPGTVAVINEYLGEREALGVQVEIAHLSGERFWLAGTHPDLGYRLTRRTTFRWFCAIKSALAMAALSLLRTKGLSADVPVSHVIPEFSGGGRDAVTVAHLLTHTSGLPSFPATDGPADLLSAALATPLPEGCIPGRVTAYNICTAWTLIAAVTERLSGLHIADAMARLVFDPLELWSSVLAVRSVSDRRLAVQVAQLVGAQSAQKRFTVLTLPAVLAGLPAWIGGLGTLADLAGLFEYFLRVHCGMCSADDGEVVLEVTARSRGREYDNTLGRAVAYAKGTMVDISTAGFGRGWSTGSFGVGGSIDNQVVIAGWADPVRHVACAVALPTLSQLNSTQLFRIGEQIRADVDHAGGWR